jgi:hypothetical protein
MVLYIFFIVYLFFLYIFVLKINVLFEIVELQIFNTKSSE